MSDLLDDRAAFEQLCRHWKEAVVGAMKSVNYLEVRAARLAPMTPEQRASYDAAYEQAGLALRLVEFFYDARITAGLTQAELARRMRTTQPTIVRIEDGGRLPTLELLERLAIAVGMQLDVSLIATPDAPGMPG